MLPLGLEGCGLETDCSLFWPLWAALCVRAPHLDHQSEGESFQAAVCGVRWGETAAHRQLHGLELQPPSPAVSSIYSANTLWKFCCLGLFF